SVTRSAASEVSPLSLHDALPISGKTTLFKCIAGLESHDGDVESDLHPLKDKLGYLPTDPFFFAKMTGREYLELVTRARGVILARSEEHTSELQSRENLVCRLLLE